MRREQRVKGKGEENENKEMTVLIRALHLGNY